MNTFRLASLSKGIMATLICLVVFLEPAHASVRFEHIAINVENPKDVADWYVSNLDLEIISANERMIFVGDYEHHCMFEFYRRPDAEIGYANLSHDSSHVSFATDNADTLVKKMVEGGAEILKRFTSPAGDTVINLKDPWGNNLQVIQRLKPKL